jgi:hypothetical protein
MYDVRARSASERREAERSPCVGPVVEVASVASPDAPDVTDRAIVS